MAFCGARLILPYGGVWIRWGQEWWIVTWMASQKQISSKISGCLEELLTTPVSASPQDCRCRTLSSGNPSPYWLSVCVCERCSNWGRVANIRPVSDLGPHMKVAKPELNRSDSRWFVLFTLLWKHQIWVTYEEKIWVTLLQSERSLRHFFQTAKNWRWWQWGRDC